MSISNIFFPAFLYENEMKDLFGVKINNIVLDFNGNLYKVAQKTPMNPKN
jgi:ech hydrogenase subunit D